MEKSIVHSRPTGSMSDQLLRSLGGALTGARITADNDALFALARQHRVALLIDAFHARQRDDRRLALAAALLAEREATAICGAAQALHIDLLIIKGAALAYTHYASPELRPRDDLDVLVRFGDVNRAGALLEQLGYSRDVEADSVVWTGQRHYTKTAAGTSRVDLHWRAVNPQAFSDALDFDLVWSRSVPVPALGRHARTLSPGDSLLLACLHRVAHHQDRVDLLWLWDVHLLASSMTSAQFPVFAEDARRVRAARVCARSLSLATDLFGTVTPAGIIEALGAVEDEPSSAFLESAMSPFDVARADFAALGGWRERAGLLREHLLPPASYMRERYAGWPAVLLPIAYLHRMIRGAPRWLQR